MSDIQQVQDKVTAQVLNLLTSQSGYLKRDTAALNDQAIDLVGSRGLSEAYGPRFTDVIQRAAEVRILAQVAQTAVYTRACTGEQVDLALAGKSIGQTYFTAPEPHSGEDGADLPPSPEADALDRILEVLLEDDETAAAARTRIRRILEQTGR